LVLEAGDRIAADGILIKSIDIKTDEAVLTGESTPVDKSVGITKPDTPIADRKNSVFMATHVTYGRGKAVVTSTGMNTEFGKIAEMVQAVEEEETPLKIKLSRFAKTLGKFIVVICAVIFALELYDIFFVLKLTESADIMKNIIEMFMTAVALAVSAVPEGLPAVVTVTLALGARELAKQNAIIRKLSSAETLGATTVICSDKTGTLTKGEMTVRKIYVSGKIIEVSGVGYEPKGEFSVNGKKIDVEKDEHLNLLLRISSLCNNARYDGKKITGDPTEGSLLVASVKAGMKIDELENKFPRLHEIPFSSERKRMTTIHKIDGKRVAYVKGAPEIIVERCSYVYDKGKIKKLSKEEKQKILRINEQMASEALRVLGMAYRELPEKFTEDLAEKNLIFVGLMGMIDPPRKEAKRANRLCQEAGIKTIMITGDHKLTAMAIAKELGMLKSDSVLTGEELDDMSDKEFEKIVENVTVYARVSPEHKIRIVKALKKKGHIVAMTGDGVNDAPALKQADIGVAMGITGTDVTKEASDMVLADDNFATIVRAVRGGRIIYDNIRKFVFFLMRCNFDELAVIGTFALLGLPLPLNAAMILWINLVTDGAPAIALSMDPPAEDVMKRKPRNTKHGVLHGRLTSVIVSFITQFAGTAFVFWLSYFVWNYPLEKAMTMAFMQATMRELVIVWNCRSEKRSVFRMSPITNKYLLIAVIASFLLTLSLVYVPIFQAMFGTAPLSLKDLLIVAALGCSGLLLLPEFLYGRKIWRWE
jgi:Ca2+-transporting ATPase